MTWDRRSGTTYRARNAVSQLASRSIPLPDSITAAVADLDRIESATPREPDRTAIRQAIVAGANTDEINDLVLAELAFTRLRGEYLQAAMIAAQGILAAVRAESDHLHAELAARANTAIGQLAAVAALDGASLETLVRDGRHDDAQALVEVDVAGAELQALYEFRDSYLTPGGPESARAGHINCTQYRDPRIAARHHRADLDVTGNYLRALRQGAELWFPTPEEALAAAAPIYAQWEREAVHAANKQRDVGSVVAF
jgi:hypothetical protein